MTNEELQAKAEQLSVQHSCKVHPLLFKVDGSEEQIIGFVKEPTRLTKARVMDKIMAKETFTASTELLEAILIKEVSDNRIFETGSGNDKYWLGACLAAIGLVEVAADQYKKK